MDEQKFCTHCGASLLENARFCMACGKEIQPCGPAPAPPREAAPKLKNRKPLIIGIAVSIALALLMLLFLPKGPRGVYAADEYCWIMEKIEFVDSNTAIVEDSGFTIQCRYTINGDTIRLVPLNNALASTVETSFRAEGDSLYFDGYRFVKQK